MACAETGDQIRARIFNGSGPSPAITHCSCGHPLEECLRIVFFGEGCRTLEDAYYSEFLKTVPDWFFIAWMALCGVAVAQILSLGINDASGCDT